MFYSLKILDKNIINIYNICEILIGNMIIAKGEAMKDIYNPDYYKNGKIEVSDFIEDKGFNFFLGNVVKYVSRAGKKDGNTAVQDLKKAQWYLNKEIARLEGAPKGKTVEVTETVTTFPPYNRRRVVAREEESNLYPYDEADFDWDDEFFADEDEEPTNTKPVQAIFAPGRVIRKKMVNPGGEDDA